MANSFTRRSFIKNTSAGIAAAAVAGTLGVPEGEAAEAASEGVRGRLHEILTPGLDVLDQWKVQLISPVRHGGVSVLVEHAQTLQVLRIDVCAKGGDAKGVELAGPCELFLMNGGTGSTKTPRDHHVVVRALAHHIDSVDESAEIAKGLLPQNLRLETFGAQALGSDPF